MKYEMSNDHYMDRALLSFLIIFFDLSNYGVKIVYPPRFEKINNYPIGFFFFFKKNPTSMK